MAIAHLSLGSNLGDRRVCETYRAAPERLKC